MPEKPYLNTAIDTELLTSLKVLAAQKGNRLNQLLEAVVQDLLKKNEEKPTE